MSKPVEAFVLSSLTMTAAPAFMSSPDWYTLQGVLAGTALAALVGNGDFKQRLLRAAISLLLGYMAGQWLAELFGQTTQVGFRFVAGCVSFASWYIVFAVEKAAPSVSRKATKALGDAVIKQFSGLGVGAGDTDRAAAIYAAIAADKERAAQEAGEKSDGA